MVLATSLLALVVATRPAEAAFPGDNGLIVFSSDRDRDAQDIFTINPIDGTTDRLTTFSTGHNIDPAVSPDGSRIAFSRDGEIWVMNASGMTLNGTGATQITDTSTAKTEPTWSPDGTRIAYVANSFDVDGQTDLELWVINGDGSGRRQLTRNTFPDSQPAWSPDGSKIAFMSTRTGDVDKNVYVMNADGSGTATNLTPGTSDNPPYQGYDEGPAWSPDGTKIAHVHAFARNNSGVPNIWVMDANGNNKDNFQDNDSTSADMPAWSPDGTKIAYVGVAHLETNRDIYAMDANGANQAPIETGGNAAHDISPDWQPVDPACDISDTGTNVVNGTPADETICGLGSNDVIDGGGGNDILMGGNGNDTFIAASGRATLNGGDGNDTASFAGSAKRIDASLISGFAQRLGTDPLQGVAMVGVENLTGSGLNDVLEGSSAVNKLVGGDGADKLYGLGKSDTLNSRDGVRDNDTVDGGKGTDTCTTDRTEKLITRCEQGRAQRAHLAGAFEPRPFSDPTSKTIHLRDE